jgi:hypothetical protein
MPDSELLRFGQSAKRLCSPEVNSSKPPIEAYALKLREAREEWQRRHPELPLSESI